MNPIPSIRTVIPIAEGVEEMEAVILADVFRRASWPTHLLGLRDGPVTASRGVMLVPDGVLSDWHPEQVDLLVLPGGMGGVNALMADDDILEWCRAFADSPGKTLAAICAAPMVLEKAGVLENRRYTCHPGVADRIRAGHPLAQRVVTDGNVHTSQGPGTAFEFALHLIRALGDGNLALQLRKEMCL